MEFSTPAIINGIITFATDYLIISMVIGFFLAVVLRWLIHFTIHCEYRFISEFEKRVYKQLTHENNEFAHLNFHALTETLLQRTYYEHYQLKKKYMRRRFDYISTLSDRLFLIREAAARLIKDTLKQTQYLQRGPNRPRFNSISNFVVASNPIFNKVWGLLPMGLVNDILNILPGLFIIGGIFGTFLGVMRALPELTAIDITNVDSTKTIMDAFLLRISFSMSTSIVGIILSVSMTVLNTVMSPDGRYINLVNKLTSSLEFLWNDTDMRAVAGDSTPGSENYFDLHKDPILGKKVELEKEPAAKARGRSVGVSDDLRSTPSLAASTPWQPSGLFPSAHPAGAREVRANQPAPPENQSPQAATPAVEENPLVVTPPPPSSELPPPEAPKKEEIPAVVSANELDTAPSPTPPNAAEEGLQSLEQDTAADKSESGNGEQSKPPQASTEETQQDTMENFKSNETNAPSPLTAEAPSIEADKEPSYSEIALADAESTEPGVERVEQDAPNIAEAEPQKTEPEKKGGFFSFFRTKTIRGIDPPETEDNENQPKDAPEATSNAEQSYLAKLDTLRIRLDEVDKKIEEALNDKNEGKIDEKSWRETESALVEEKERLEQEIELLTAEADKAA